MNSPVKDDTLPPSLASSPTRPMSVGLEMPSWEYIIPNVMLGHQDQKLVEMLSVRSYVIRWAWMMILLVVTVVMFIITPETIRQIRLQPPVINWSVVYPLVLSWAVSIPLVLHIHFYVYWLEKGKIKLENSTALSWTLRFQAAVNEIVRFNALLLLFYNLVPLIYMALGQHYFVVQGEETLRRYVPQMFILYTPTLMALFLPFWAAVGAGLVQNILAIPVALSMGGDTLDGVLIDAIHNSFLVVLIVLLIKVLLEYANRLDTQRLDIYRTQLSSYQLRLEDEERETLNSLVHDRVISALVSALNPLIDKRTAGENARQSQELLRQVAAGGDIRLHSLRDIRQFIELCEARAAQILTSQSQKHQFEVLVEGADEDDPRGAATLPPQEVLQVILQTFEEAVRNCAKHARSATIRRLEFKVTWDSGKIMALTCRVIDNGPGFLPEQVSPSRLGLQYSIFGRMREVPGCRAKILSTPGNGTTVKLSWKLKEKSREHREDLLPQKLSQFRLQPLDARPPEKSLSREVHVYYRDILASPLGWNLMVLFGIDVSLTMLAVMPHYLHDQSSWWILVAGVATYLGLGLGIIYRWQWRVGQARAILMQILAAIMPAWAVLNWRDISSRMRELPPLLAQFLGRSSLETLSGTGATNMILAVPTSFIVLAAFLLAGGKVRLAWRLGTLSAVSYLLGTVAAVDLFRLGWLPKYLGLETAPAVLPGLGKVAVLLIIVMAALVIVQLSVWETKRAREAELRNRERYLNALEREMHNMTAQRLRVAAISKVKSLVDPVFTALQQEAEADSGQDSFSAELLSRCRALEGRLRDMIRSPKLDNPALAEAIETARGRGITVRLLDDTPPELTDLSAVLSWLEQVTVPVILAAAETGHEDTTVVIRVAMRSGQASCTVVVRNGVETLSFNEFSH